MKDKIETCINLYLGDAMERKLEKKEVESIWRVYKTRERVKDGK